MLAVGKPAPFPSLRLSLSDAAICDNPRHGVNDAPFRSDGEGSLSPEGPSYDRVNRVEQDLARMSERYKALAEQVKAFLPLPIKVTEVAAAVVQVATSLADLSKDFDELKRDLTDVNKMHIEERRSLRVALIGLTGVILAAIIGGVFLLVAS
jgi:hypothetical protein